ncbi:acyltransferase [Serratia marcescens]|nr:acyltransferase [Serratia marcescens]
MKTEILPKINSIQYLRGIAALLVIFYHLRFDLNNVYSQKDIGNLLFESAAFGVDLFFVISGFIIMYATERKEHMQGVKYFIRRWFRIYPLLILCIVFYFFFISSSEDYSLFYRSLIPLNSNYSGGSPFYGYNILMPAWTLTFEISFYGIFLMSILISHRYRGLICSAMILSFVIGIQVFFNKSISFNGYNNFNFAAGSILHAPLTLLSSPMFIDFIYGIIIFYLLRKSKGLIIKKRALFISVSFLLIISSTYLLMTKQVVGHGPTAWGLVGMVVITCLLTIEASGALAHSNTLSFLGNISYSLYLTQAVVLEFFDKYSNNLPFVIPAGVFKFFIFTLVIIVISYITYRIIELPFVAFGKRIISRIERKQEVTARA